MQLSDLILVFVEAAAQNQQVIGRGMYKRKLYYIHLYIYRMDNNRGLFLILLSESAVLLSVHKLKRKLHRADIPRSLIKESFLRLLTNLIRHIIRRICHYYASMFRLPIGA